MQSSNNEVKELISYLKEIDLYKITGRGDRISNINGMEIAKTTTKEYAEGLVKCHHDFILTLNLLEEISTLSDGMKIKEKIKCHITNCIG